MAGVESRHLPASFGPAQSKGRAGTLEEQLATAERSAVESAIEASGGNRAQAARLLGIQ